MIGIFDFAFMLIQFNFFSSTLVFALYFTLWQSFGPFCLYNISISNFRM